MKPTTQSRQIRIQRTRCKATIHLSIASYPCFLIKNLTPKTIIKHGLILGSEDLGETISTRSCCHTAIHEYVIPRSIPITGHSFAGHSRLLEDNGNQVDEGRL
jgi:hypothetical protein